MGDFRHLEQERMRILWIGESHPLEFKIVGGRVSKLGGVPLTLKKNPGFPVTPLVLVALSEEIYKILGGSW